MSLDHIRIVLVNTSHPGNIGATARAMKNMGLKHLYLVAPDKFPSDEATVRSTGAVDILLNAVVVDDLLDAIGDCTMVYGTSARGRTLPWPLCTPKEFAPDAVRHNLEKVAIVFGRESSGLTNQELALCQKHIWIPTVPEFSSLNLSQAVQIVAYELHQALLVAETFQPPSRILATTSQVNGFLNHLIDEMIQSGFMDENRNAMLRKRLHRLFSRAQLEVEEVNILRGFLTSLEKK
jgi:tRNA (cytidine32/uridine32-2'-O)-methyltransferase